MSRGKSAVFLDRGSYRRRRMRDALRLVTVLGIILWLIPVAWPEARTATVEPPAMSVALLYIFGVWLFLIVMAAILAWLRADETASDKTDKKSPERVP